jgi:DNA-binding MarR family transcriptional regulator
MKNNPGDKDILHRFWGVFHRASDLTERYMDVLLLKEVGITYQQFLVLMVIQGIGRRANVGDIAVQLDRTQNTISVLLERMKKDGLVRKIRNMSDRRMVRVAATEKGRLSLKKATDIGWIVFKELLVPLTEDEVSTLIVLLDKLESATKQKLLSAKTF